MGFSLRAKGFFVWVFFGFVCVGVSFFSFCFHAVSFTLLLLCMAYVTEIRKMKMMRTRRKIMVAGFQFGFKLI